ncbi:MAG: hypothetical protein LBL61_02885, partial [Elusimicrobiota bacterium]|nr:hypothetical protein [Elusimicrobiota bacterium]
SLVVGRWSLVVGRWSLVVGRWSLVVGRWSLVVGRCLILLLLESNFCLRLKIITLTAVSNNFIIKHADNKVNKK